MNSITLLSYSFACYLYSMSLICKFNVYYINVSVHRFNAFFYPSASRAIYFICALLITFF